MCVSRLLCILLLAGLCAGSLLGFASSACAAETSGSILQANLIYEFAADRGRMIQISLVFVAVGCALIWWYR
ncbi:MAG TPA: hypothetical protein VFE62_09335 [Gemmataceae bacterium]|nr:hypothetical protein [Gemmataceae bacterium]